MRERLTKVLVGSVDFKELDQEDFKPVDESNLIEKVNQTEQVIAQRDHAVDVHIKQVRAKELVVENITTFYQKEVHGVEREERDHNVEKQA